MWLSYVETIFSIKSDFLNGERLSKCCVNHLRKRHFWHNFQNPSIGTHTHGKRETETESVAVVATDGDGGGGGDITKQEMKDVLLN